MEPLDVVKHVGLGGFERCVLMLMDSQLEHAEEALAGGIVAAVADGAHRAQQRILLQESLVVPALELTAAVGVQNHRAPALSLPDGHLHSPDHHLPILPVMHRAADDQLAEQIEYHAQIQLSFTGLELGDVGNPLGLGLGRFDVALQTIQDIRCWQSWLTAHASALLPRLTKNALDFPVLSDIGLHVARAYGLAFDFTDDLRRLYLDRWKTDLVSWNGDGGWSLPVPATFVIGKDARVLFAHVDPDFRERSDPDEVLAALRR